MRESQLGDEARQLLRELFSKRRRDKFIITEVSIVTSRESGQHDEILVRYQRRSVFERDNRV